MRQRDFRDPLEVLLKREEETCKGCRNERVVKAWGEFHTVCRFKARKHGARCEQYEERPVVVPAPAKAAK